MRQFEGAGIRRPRSTAPRSACNAWATSRPSTSRTPAGAGQQRPGRRGVQRQGNHSGSFVFGLGYSQLSGLTTSIQLSQNNFLGGGNRVSVEAQRSDYLQRYSFSFVNPFFTDEGMSLGYNMWWREFDYSELQHRPVLDHQRRRAGRAGPADHRERHGLAAVRHRHATRSSTFRGSTPAVDHRLHRCSRQPHLPCLAHGTGLGARYPQRLLHADRGTYQRVPPKSPCPARPSSTTSSTTSSPSTGRSAPSLVLNTRAEVGYGDSYGDDTTRRFCAVRPATPRPRRSAAPCAPGTASKPRDGHRDRPAVLRELLCRRRALGARLPRQHAGPALGGNSAASRPAAGRLAEDDRFAGNVSSPSCSTPRPPVFRRSSTSATCSPAPTISTQASCAPRPASPCCGARRWARSRSATPSRCARKTTTRSSACSSPSAARSERAHADAASKARLSGPFFYPARPRR